MKVENLTKYICDVCGKIEYAKKDESSPIIYGLVKGCEQE